MPDQSKPDQYLVNRLAHSTLSRETNHAVATAVQQSLIAAVGPIAWLATGGVLYMRVSYNEAGALIGSEGSRIQQLMQITGAEIYIGKNYIST
ncbi:KH domain-containing-like protein [Schistosoma japonicum]|uniref:KH domain-containing-like protein n=1 Tax=Schistosoma japonicum TaxID=6182 RepID=A0A4Z2CNK6_SCHJA|nr:KH domain-containing-like protein [Schistosoma japonicum]